MSAFFGKRWLSVQDETKPAMFRLTIEAGKIRFELDVL
jgi:hypothetical protein